MGIIDQIIGVESGGDPNASNPNSSAVGLGQFTAPTWMDTISRHRPDLIEGKSPDEILALRTDPELSRQMTGALAGDNAGILRSAGAPVTPGSTYLAHFAGPKGAIGLLNSDPSAPVESILGARAVAANPFLRGKTAADVISWADSKMGGAGPGRSAAPMAMAGPQAAAGAAPSAPPQPLQPTAPTPQAAPAAPPQFDMAALSATPQLPNILQPPRLILGRPAPFSLRG